MCEVYYICCKVIAFILNVTLATTQTFDKFGISFFFL